MNLFFRMMWVWWLTRRQARIQPHEEVVLHFRVLPNDLDVFGHMNNARYLSIMDLGRLALVIRTGIFPRLFSHKWVTLVAASRLRHRRSLSPFARYELRTRIAYWDAKWFYIEQRFFQNDFEVATGWVKGLLRGPTGNISTSEVLAAIGLAEVQAPAIEGSIKLWIEMEESLSGQRATA